MICRRKRPLWFALELLADEAVVSHSSKNGQPDALPDPSTICYSRVKRRVGKPGFSPKSLEKTNKGVLPARPDAFADRVTSGLFLPSGSIALLQTCARKRE